MTTYLLDTNILSAIIRKEANVERRFRQAVDGDDVFLLSMVVFYEVKRGLLKRDAKKQMVTLENLANQLPGVIPFWQIGKPLRGCGQNENNAADQLPMRTC